MAQPTAKGWLKCFGLYSLWQSSNLFLSGPVCRLISTPDLLQQQIEYLKRRKVNPHYDLLACINKVPLCVYAWGRWSWHLRAIGPYDWWHFSRGQLVSLFSRHFGKQSLRFDSPFEELLNQSRIKGGSAAERQQAKRWEEETTITLPWSVKDQGQSTKFKAIGRCFFFWKSLPHLLPNLILPVKPVVYIFSPASACEMYMMATVHRHLKTKKTICPENELDNRKDPILRQFNMVDQNRDSTVFPSFHP